MKCWECEIEGVPLHNHHPVPKSRGGTKTIPLCEPCHSKAHHRKKNMNTSELTKEALWRIRAGGVKLGNPRYKEALPKARAAKKTYADDFALSMKPTIDLYRKAGIEGFTAIAKNLNQQTRTTRNGCSWTAQSVKNLIKRLDAIKEGWVKINDESERD